MSSHEQVSRLLSLVPYLQAHRGAPVTQVAEIFGISRRQLLADLDVLWMCGLPGGLPGDLIDIDMDAAREPGGVIYLSNADYLTRPMRFTLDEAMSLIVALRAVQETASGPTAEHVASARAKLEGLVGSASSRVGIQLETGTSGIREIVTAAIERRRALQLTYDGAARGVTTYPVVDPVRIDVRDGAAYLIAWSRGREDWRNFRLDRIADARQLDEAARDHGPAPAPTAGWFDDAAGATEVTLELTSAASWVTEYYPTRAVVQEGDLLVATVTVVDPHWLTGLLLRLGGEARVRTPTGADAETVAEATAAIAAYQGLQGRATTSDYS